MQEKTENPKLHYNLRLSSLEGKHSDMDQAFSGPNSVLFPIPMIHLTLKRKRKKGFELSLDRSCMPQNLNSFLF